MRKSFYLPASGPDHVVWLQTFSGKLPNYAAKYGITQAELFDTQSGSNYLAALIPLHGNT